jgi:hypothetical protein
MNRTNEGGGLALEMDHSLSAAMTPAHVVTFRSASFVRLIVEVPMACLCREPRSPECGCVEQVIGKRQGIDDQGFL